MSTRVDSALNAASNASDDIGTLGNLLAPE